MPIDQNAENVNNRASPGRRQRRSCACGCLIVVLAALALAYGLLRLAAGWTSDASAWDHMPASTVLAVEAYGAPDILAALVEDGYYDAFLAGLPAEGSATLKEARGFLDLYSRLPRFIQAVAAPGTALFGTASGYGKDVAPFGIIKLSALAKLVKPFVVSESDGTVVAIADAAGSDMYCVFIDEWCAFSLSRDLTDEISAGWATPRHALGKAAELKTPYLAVAMLTDAVLPLPNAKPAAPTAVNPFLSGQSPFDQIEPPAGGAESEAGIWRVLMQPGSGEWDVRGGWSALADSSAEARGFNIPDAILPPVFPGGKGLGNGADMGFAIVFPHRDDGDNGMFFEKWFARPNPASERPLRTMGWLWARQGWLKHAAGDFVLVVSDPPNGKTSISMSPKLPVFSLGWRTHGGQTTARDNFNAAAALFFEVLTAPGGSPLGHALRASVKFQPLDDGYGGAAVELPTVLGYGAEPCWRFNDPGPDAAGYGFLASDPAGLPVDVGLFGWRGFTEGERPDGGKIFAISGSWNLSEPFRNDTVRIVKEVALSLEGVGEHRAAALSTLNGLPEALLSLCRRGTLAAMYDPADSRCVFAATLARGMRDR